MTQDAKMHPFQYLPIIKSLMKHSQRKKSSKKFTNSFVACSGKFNMADFPETIAEPYDIDISLLHTYNTWGSPWNHWQVTSVTCHPRTCFCRKTSDNNNKDWNQISELSGFRENMGLV